MPVKTRSSTRYTHASPKQYVAWERRFWAEAERSLKQAAQYKETW